MRTLAVPLPWMRRSVGASVSTRWSGRSVPARSGAMAPVARGADLTATLPFAMWLREASRDAASPAPPASSPNYGRGTFNPPGGCAAARRLLTPLPALRDSYGCDPAARLGPGTPRCLLLRGITDTPASIRAPGPRSLRRHGRWHPPGGLKTPHPQIGELILGAGVPAWRDGSCIYTANGRVVVRSAPRAAGAMAPKCAGTERASRGGVSLAWLHTNSEGPHRGTSLRGRTRRRVGGLGSMPSPSDRSKPAGQERSRHAVERKKRAAHPLGKTKAVMQ